MFMVAPLIYQYTYIGPAFRQPYLAVVIGIGILFFRADWISSGLSPVAGKQSSDSDGT